MLTLLAAKWAMIPSRAKWGIAIALAIALAFWLTYYNGKQEGRASADLALEKANNEAIVIDSRAREAAAVDRVIDAEKNLEAKKELSDAVESLPDTMPSARRIALGCQQLRRQGTNVSAVAACRGR